MTDDERMDRARRIREMREGSRPDDDAQTDHDADDSEVDGGDESHTAADDAAEDAADDAARSDPADAETVSGSDAAGGDDGRTGASVGDDEADPADGNDAADAADGDGDEDSTIHVPGADVGDVDVDVEEMARQAGLESVDEGSEPASDGDRTTGGSAIRAEEAAEESTEETRVLEFALGSERYCLDIEYVEEIVKRESVTRVPNTPDCVEGVVDLRGQITTILDPKVLLDIDESGSKGLIVVFDPDTFDDQGAVGWIVDDVEQVTPVAEDEVNASPVEQDHVNGVVDRDGEFVIWTTPELDVEELAG